MTEIRECGRTVGGGTVAVDVSWDGALAGGRVAWVVSIASQDNRERVRLVHERADGDFVAQYVESGGRRQEVPEDADVAEDHLTARFPADVVGVAVEWPVWKAALTVDGEPVAESVMPVS